MVFFIHKGIKEASFYISFELEMFFHFFLLMKKLQKGTNWAKHSPHEAARRDSAVGKSQKTMQNGYTNP